MSNRLFATALVLAGISGAAAVPAYAAPNSSISSPGPQVRSTASAKSIAVAVPAPTQASSGPGQSLDDADLGNCRGSGGLVVGNQTLNAISTGNSTIASYTAGAVNFSDQALSNFNGFGNITVNTGALSQLQSAMNITVNVNP